MILLPSSSHYSWTKAASFFGLGAKGLKVVAADHFGLMDIRALKNEIELSLKTKTPIISVVSICGTTELGTVDRIEAIQDILDSYRKKEGFDLWHHVDAAYGGYFATVKEIRDPAVSPELRRSLKAISRSTSVTIDPHKLGYVPYSSGAFICREKKDYYLTESLPPYVAFERHHDPGPYTMEGSRSAAGAVATYLTSRCIGLDAKGYGSVILRSLHNTRLLKEELQAVQIPVLFVESEITNILCFAVGSRESSLSELNHQTRKAIKYFERHAKNSFFISKTVLGQNFSALLGDFCLRYDLVPDEDHLVVIRLTLMNPFTRSKHSKTDYIGEFIRTLSKAIASI